MAAGTVGRSAGRIASCRYSARSLVNAIDRERRALEWVIRFQAETKNPTTAKAVIGFNEVWRASAEENQYWEVTAII
jgi:hypothetical protein